MAEYTVLRAEHKKAIDGRNGPMQVIALRLSDGTNEHEAEWFTKAATEVPATNTRLEGTLEAGQYGLKFKKAYSGGAGGARPRDPKESAAIQRQSSQRTAVMLLQAKATAGLLGADDLTPANLRKLTEFFEDDIAVGVERKHPTQRTVRGLPVKNEPERTGTPDIPVEPYQQVEEHPDARDVPWEAA